MLRFEQDIPQRGEHLESRPLALTYDDVLLASGFSYTNGYVESTGGRLREELLDREVFHTLLKVQVLAEQYRQTYNRVRPHSSLGYRPPAPEAILPAAGDRYVVSVIAGPT